MFGNYEYESLIQDVSLDEGVSIRSDWSRESWNFDDEVVSITEDTSVTAPFNPTGNSTGLLFNNSLQLTSTTSTVDFGESLSEPPSVTMAERNSVFNWNDGQITSNVSEQQIIIGQSDPNSLEIVEDITNDNVVVSMDSMQMSFQSSSWDFIGPLNTLSFENQTLTMDLGSQIQTINTWSMESDISGIQLQGTTIENQLRSTELPAGNTASPTMNWIERTVQSSISLQMPAAPTNTGGEIFGTVSDSTSTTVFGSTLSGLVGPNFSFNSVQSETAMQFGGIDQMISRMNQTQTDVSLGLAIA